MEERSISLLYGEEKYLIETQLNKIKKQFGEKISGINYIQLDSTNIENIIQDIQTPAFGYSKKLIIIRDSQLFKKAKADKTKVNKGENKFEKQLCEYMKENINSINESVDMIFIEDEVEKNELYKTIESLGNVIEYKKLKIPDLIKNLKNICNLYKVNVDNNTLAYFIEVCGTDMQTLINEIRKQIEFAKEGGTITRESIDEIAIKQLDSVIFDLTDNLGKKNIKEALIILSNMLYAKEPIQKILIMLYNHFKKLYFTKIAINENRNIAEALDLKANQLFLVQKYTNQSKYFTKEELSKILQEMINLDYNSKIGNIDINIGLETVLCECCT